MTDQKEVKLQEVQKVLDSVFIRHSAFKTIKSQFDECLNSYTGHGEPICMLVHGHSGVGKTTLASSYLADYPPVYLEERKIVPVLNAVIPVPATMKNMASELLEKLGDPYSDRGTLEQRTKRLRKLLKECKTELIILDEFQHFIDRKSERVILDVSDWLKNLISNTSIPVVLVGLSYSREVLFANEQLMRRFSYQAEMKPFSWDDGHSRKEFVKILSVIDRELANVFGNKAGFTNYANRFYAATKGLIALMIKLIRGSAREAVVSASDRIELRHLAKAYKDRLLTNNEMANPFSSNWDGEYADPLPEIRHLGGNMAAARMLEKRSLSNVLSTR